MTNFPEQLLCARHYCRCGGLSSGGGGGMGTKTSVLVDVTFRKGSQTINKTLSDNVCRLLSRDKCQRGEKRSQCVLSVGNRLRRSPLRRRHC